MHLTLSWATLTLGAWTLLGQPLTSTRRATITGRGGDGKCTIEVEVDGSAEVEVSGDVGLLRTLSGQPQLGGVSNATGHCRGILATSGFAASMAGVR